MLRFALLHFALLHFASKMLSVGHSPDADVTIRTVVPPDIRMNKLILISEGTPFTHVPCAPGSLSTQRSLPSLRCCIVIRTDYKF